MKLSFLLSISYLTWTVQTYTERELTHKSDFLLAQHLGEQSNRIEQTVFARGLAPVKIYALSPSESIYQRSRSSFVKRASPPGSPPESPRQGTGNTNSPGSLRAKIKSQALLTALTGAAAGGSMIGVAATTDWNDRSRAYPAALGMTCFGAIALTSVCANYIDTRKKYMQLRNSASIAAQGRQAHLGAHNGRVGSSTELQTVPPLQAPSRAPSPSTSGDPSDLVRRFIGSTRII